ncbi:biopolymer transport protein ExbD [Hymenobacter luteus]|uniref:Biopolymer transport protein ExbD n=3 Tax=Hymenobacter TaxID=89966 RepID=A0A7W9T2K6_9BACT|nr:MULTISPECIES: biopolymer transporter ExbD [Hymenobacter]MBB4602018.1 biopolymer transport protein ExbD [Hymenobacter latericoloratus]MBB6059553.1 biopolymer transport protein ExbD [Hymenobacter luteus]MBX0289665.1 biopolymer transporter ExbD [Hymenobacter sp. HSC-4F20]RPD45772.1 biopolymer transporter ExbD [Hymenobacter sediminis]GGG50659.1 biopolymer transporter ExbD [Hymenobacter glacieicola]
MDLSRRRKVSSHVETSSMNDIMFFLMLFFLIVSTMVNPNVIKLMLPNARSGKQAMKQPITVSVDAAGKYFIDRQNITPDQLEPELARRVQGLESPTAVLRVDASLNVQKLVDILEVGNRLKIKMVMATQAQQASGK